MKNPEFRDFAKRKSCFSRQNEEMGLKSLEFRETKISQSRNERQELTSRYLNTLKFVPINALQSKHENY